MDSSASQAPRCHYCESAIAAKLYTAVLANSGLAKLHTARSTEDERSRVLKSQLKSRLKSQVQCLVIHGSCHPASSTNECDKRVYPCFFMSRMNLGNSSSSCMRLRTVSDKLRRETHTLYNSLERSRRGYLMRQID